MSVELHHGDCMDVIKTMRDKSVDFCFTDPPYNVGKDYGAYKDALKDIEYFAWIGTIIDEIKRVAKTSCIFIPQKHILYFWNLLGPEFKQIILSYSPAGAIRWGFSNQFSSLLTNAAPNTVVRNVWHNTQMTGLGWFFREETYGHPGYTSRDITGRVIENFTGPGQTILDPFMGTGTTGIECVGRKRNFIGIEQEDKWFALAKKRIENTQERIL